MESGINSFDVPSSKLKLFLVVQAFGHRTLIRGFTTKNCSSPVLSWVVYKTLNAALLTHWTSKVFLQDAISNVQNVKIAFNIVFLGDTECSFDKKIICIFMVSSPFSFQKSIPTPEICYFEGKSAQNRSHRIMHLKLKKNDWNSPKMQQLGTLSVHFIPFIYLIWFYVSDL